jgi:hypothetical protein
MTCIALGTKHVFPNVLAFETTCMHHVNVIRNGEQAKTGQSLEDMRLRAHKQQNVSGATFPPCTAPEAALQMMAHLATTAGAGWHKDTEKMVKAICKQSAGSLTTSMVKGLLREEKAFKNPVVADYVAKKSTQSKVAELVRGGLTLHPSHPNTLSSTLDAEVWLRPRAARSMALDRMIATVEFKGLENQVSAKRPRCSHHVGQHSAALARHSKALGRCGTALARHSTALPGMTSC